MTPPRFLKFPLAGIYGLVYLLCENGNMAYSERISLAHITQNDLERGISE